MRWAQLTLVENDPGRFDPQFWLDYFRRLHADAATLSAGGIVAYYPTEVPLHHRSAWLGDAIRSATLVAGCRDAGHARRRAHGSARGARRGAGGASGLDCRRRRRRAAAALGEPGLWVTCALGPYNFEFMDQVHREIVDEVQRRRHLREPLGAAGRRLLLRALRSELQGRDRPRAAAHDRSPRSGAAGVHRVAQGAADRAVEAMGRRRCAPPIPRRASFPNGPPDLKTAGELADDPVRGLPGAARPDAAVGERPAREGVPRRDGPPADRRHLQRRARGAVSLEGLGAERAGDPALGRRGHRQRHAAVGDEVLGRALRSPLAAGRRAHLRLALSSTSATCATRRRWRASRCSTRSRPRPTIRASPTAIAPATTCSGCITR